MRRAIELALAAALLLPGIAVAAEEELCLRVDPGLASLADADTVTLGFERGWIEVLEVVPCGEPAAPTIEVPEGGPLPVTIDDYGFTAFPKRDDDYLNWAVVLSNPNEVGWAAQMEVIIDFLDGAGDVVTTTNEYVTLLPGQTTALAGTEFDAGAARQMEVVVSNSEDDWEELDYETGYVEFSRVKTKRQDGDTVTTGKATSTFIERQEDIEVIVVWRDGSGDIVGGDQDYIPFLDPDATRSFKVDTYYRLPKVAETDAYWSL